MNLVEKMRISPDGQITIPENIREKAGLLPGCDVEFHVENGRVWLAPQITYMPRSPIWIGYTSS